MSYYDHTDSAHPMSNESDAIDLIAKCFETDCRAILLHQDSVAPDFFVLRTGVLGACLQKFTNYSIKVALVCDDDQLLSGRMGEFVLETNKGDVFRVYPDALQAAAWLNA